MVARTPTIALQHATTHQYWPPNPPYTLPLTRSRQLKPGKMQHLGTLSAPRSAPAPIG